MRPRSNGYGSASSSARARSKAAKAAARSPSAAAKQAAAARSGRPSPSGSRARCACARTARGSARLLELAQRDQRLDRVRPRRGCVGSFIAASEQPSGELAQVAAGRLEVAERKLESAEDAEDDDA